MENEIYVPVKGFEGRFKVSNIGNVISINGRYLGEKVMPCTIDQSGYKATTLQVKGKRWCVRVHTLVAMHFVENPKPGVYDTVNHMDGVKQNNWFENLEWCTRGMNTSHAVAIGLVDKKGEKHFNSKLTDTQVMYMRYLYQAGKLQRELAEMFGIGRRHVSDIVNRVCWAHI